MKGAALLVVLMLAGVPGALAQTQPVVPTTIGDSFADPAMESRARNMQRQLRCLVCQGESIDESNSPLAADLWLAPFLVLGGAGAVAWVTVKKAAARKA